MPAPTAGGAPPLTPRAEARLVGRRALARSQPEVALHRHTGHAVEALAVALHLAHLLVEEHSLDAEERHEHRRQVERRLAPPPPPDAKKWRTAQVVCRAR